MGSSGWFWATTGSILLGMVIIVSIWRSQRRTSGGSSATLGILRSVIAFCLLMVMMVNTNDLYIVYLQSQKLPPPKSIVTKALDVKDRLDGKVARTDSKKASRPTTKRKGRVRRNASKKSIQVRQTHKYSFRLLELLALLAMFSYVLSKPETWDFVERFTVGVLLSWRGVERRAKSLEDRNAVDDDSLSDDDVTESGGSEPPIPD